MDDSFISVEDTQTKFLTSDDIPPNHTYMQFCNFDQLVKQEEKTKRRQVNDDAYVTNKESYKNITHSTSSSEYGVSYICKTLALAAALTYIISNVRDS